MAIKGKVVVAEGDPKSHHYTIEGDDGNEYFAHVGDLSENEEIVYHSPNRADLNRGDYVEFEPVVDSVLKLRAIHLKKVK